MHTEDTLQRVHVETCGERSVFERLRDHNSRRAVSLQLDDDHVPLVIYAKQVDEPSQVGADLTPDDQNPPVLKNLVGV